MQSEIVIGSVCAFLLGVGLRTIFEIPLEVVVWVMFVALGVGSVRRRNSHAISAPYLLMISLYLIAISFGIVRIEVASWQFENSPLSNSVDNEINIEGVVVKEPDYREKTIHLYIETETDKLLITTERHVAVQYGDNVMVSGKLLTPESFETDLGRIFNYPGYLKARGVQYMISFAEVEVAGSGEGNFIIALLLKAKQQFISSLQQIIPEPAVGLGNGLLLGVKSALGNGVEQDFRRTGIIHIVVLSGYNVMLVVSFIMFCFSFFLPLRWRIVSGIIAITAFALLVGLSATVVRASIMASLVLLTHVLGRRYNVIRALLLAGVVMILINPYILLYDIGFQLSFMATLGLVLILPYFESTAITKKYSLGLREFFLATLATQIAVLPLLMYHIGEVSLVAVVVNMLVLPIVPLAMLFTFITWVASFVSVFSASVVGYIATLSLQYILLVAHEFARFPYASLIVPKFSVTGIFFMYFLMFYTWWRWQKRQKVISVTADNTLDDWTIVEEFDVLSGNEKLQELPIFFQTKHKMNKT